MAERPSSTGGRTRDGEGDRASSYLLVLAVPVAIVLAWLTIRQVSTSWDLCVDLDAGGRFFYFMLIAPLSLFNWLGFAVGVAAVRSKKTPVRAVAGLAVVLAISAVVLAFGSPGPEVECIRVTG